MTSEDRVVEELSLLLLHLTSWTEDLPGGSVQRAWKGYPFDVLDTLQAKGLISQSRSAKSVHLTPDGVAKAEQLKRRYVRDDNE
jgi:hypothetical protein